MDWLEDDYVELEDDHRSGSRPAGAVRVAIADHSRLAAEALMFTFDSDPKLDAIGYALDGWAALELVASHEPDVVVVGEGLTGLEQVPFVELVHEAFPSVCTILLRGRLVPEEVRAAYAAGAHDCLPTSCSADELLHAIQAARGRQIASARPREKAHERL
jgi:DNA-binding NarL/FixJ family response regulator